MLLQSIKASLYKYYTREEKKHGYCISDNAPQYQKYD